MHIRNLAGQTFWYGISTVFARFLNYLLTPYLTKVLLQSEYGEMSLVYAAIAFISVIFMHGLETAYFRFSTSKAEEQKVFNTASTSLLFSTALLFSLLLIFRQEIATLVSIKEHPEYITWSAYIIALDALTSLAFAKLRFQERPIKYAFVRMVSIIINILAVFFFLSLCPRLQLKYPHSILLFVYNNKIGFGYVIIANIIQSAICLVLLYKEFFSFQIKFDTGLWKKIILYSMPLIIVGLCNVINENADRIMLGWWGTGTDLLSIKAGVGTYSACSKLAGLITIAIQAFRLGAEPFFFKVAAGENPQKLYSKVMNVFVIAMCAMFLIVSLNLDIWKLFIQNPLMWAGLKVVPILLFANIFLGIYYNLSIWFNLKNRTIVGAVITFTGALITVGINYLFIPRYGYIACAWATFFCYGSMVLLTYFWGQKVYPISYPIKKIIGYMALSILLYFVYWLFRHLDIGMLVTAIFSFLLFCIFCFIVIKSEKEELGKIPFFNKSLWQRRT